MKFNKYIHPKCILALSVALSVAVTVNAQAVDELQLIRELHDEGFEDIKLKVCADTLIAQFEDRAHRGTFRGAATAIRHTAQRHPELRHFQLVLTDYRMPQLIVRASKREGIWDVRVDREMEAALSSLRGRSSMFPSTGRLDITFYPMVSLVNNYLDHLFDWSVRIAPAFAMNLWPGGRLTIQPIFPVAHYLANKADHKRFIQPGCINLSQQIVFNKRWQLSAAVGSFIPERWGVQAKATFHATRTLDFYVDAGVTGEVCYSKYDHFWIYPFECVNAMAGLNFYEPRTKLQMELAGGRFLYGDYGLRADITRHFCEYTVGIYAIYTGGETNAGFHFSLPISGKRQKRNGVVRLRLPEYYSMEYSMNSWFKYYIDKMGEYYLTQPDQNRSAHFWQPNFIEEYVRRTLNEGFDLSRKEKAQQTELQTKTYETETFNQQTNNPNY